jgi:hypothetical protein
MTTDKKTGDVLTKEDLEKAFKYLEFSNEEIYFILIDRLTNYSYTVYQETNQMLDKLEKFRKHNKREVPKMFDL